MMPFCIATWVLAIRLSLARHYLDLDIDAGRQTETLIERLDRLAGRLMNFDHAFMRANLELLTRLPVDVGRAEHGVAFDARRQRNRSDHDGAGALRGLHDLARRAIEHFMIEGFHADTDALTLLAGHVRSSQSPNDSRRTTLVGLPKPVKARREKQMEFVCIQGPVRLRYGQSHRQIEWRVPHDAAEMVRHVANRGHRNRPDPCTTFAGGEIGRANV